MYLAPVTDSIVVEGLEFEGNRGYTFEGNRGYTAMGRHGTRRLRVKLTTELPLAADTASDRVVDQVAIGKLAPPCPSLPAACGVWLVLPSVHEEPV